MDINSFVIGFKKGKASGGSGGGSGGGVELNIAYGDTAPEDTTKLWVKTTQPSGVVVSDVFETEEVGGNSFVIDAPGNTTDHSAGAIGVVDDLIYIMGGGLNSVAKGVVCYDPETKTFTEVGVSLPKHGTYYSSATVGSKIYAIGGKVGWNDYDTIYCFDAEAKTITTLSATLPYTYEEPTVAVSGTDILMFGLGSSSSTATEIIYCLDTTTDTITQLPFNMPIKVYYGSACSDGKTVYYCGGRVEGGTTNYGVYKVDKDTQTATKLSGEFTKFVSRQEAVFIDGKIIAISGGYTISVYDIETGNCTTISIQEQIGKVNWEFYASNMVAYGDGVYFFDGYNNSALTTKNENVYIFKMSTIKKLLAEGLLQLKPTYEKNIFPFINTDTVRAEVGVDKVYKGNTGNEAKEVKAALYKDGAWVTI